MGKTFVSEIESAARINAHGKIASLPFSLADGKVFSIFIVPATDTGLPIIVSVKLSQDDAASNCPFLGNCWNEPLIKEIPADAINLTTHDVYWGI